MSSKKVVLTDRTIASVAVWPVFIVHFLIESLEQFLSSDKICWWKRSNATLSVPAPRPEEVKGTISSIETVERLSIQL